MSHIFVGKKALENPTHRVSYLLIKNEETGNDPGAIIHAQDTRSPAIEIRNWIFQPGHRPGMSGFEQPSGTTLGLDSHLEPQAGVRRAEFIQAGFEQIPRRRAV